MSSRRAKTVANKGEVSTAPWKTSDRVTSALVKWGEEFRSTLVTYPFFKIYTPVFEKKILILLREVHKKFM